MSITSGAQNFALGVNSLYDLTLGSNNIAIGDGAGSNVTTGGNNIFIGSTGSNVGGGAHSTQIVMGGTSDGARSTVIGYDGKFGESPTLTSRFIGDTLTWGSGVSSVNNRTSLVQTATTSAKTIYLPDANGTVPVVPAYADLNAANAALNAGDFWWDTTLKQLRTATS